MKSQLDTSSCPNGSTITNRAGALACKRAPGAINEDGLPEGSYMNSCQGCKLEGMSANGEPKQLLSCAKCADGSGKDKAASLLLTGCDLATVGNEAGVLTCDRPAGADEAAAQREAEAKAQAERGATVAASAQEAAARAAAAAKAAAAVEDGSETRRGEAPPGAPDSGIRALDEVSQQRSAASAAHDEL